MLQLNLAVLNYLLSIRISVSWRSGSKQRFRWRRRVLAGRRLLPAGIFLHFSWLRIIYHFLGDCLSLFAFGGDVHSCVALTFIRWLLLNEGMLVVFFIFEFFIFCCVARGILAFFCHKELNDAIVVVLKGVLAPNLIEELNDKLANRRRSSNSLFLRYVRKLLFDFISFRGLGSRSFWLSPTPLCHDVVWFHWSCSSHCDTATLSWRTFLAPPIGLLTVLAREAWFSRSNNLGQLH